MPPHPVDVPTGEQLADDLDGLGQHLVPHVRRRPTPADDVLVQVLPRSEPESKPTFTRQQRDRGGLLGDDRRVVTDGRTRHVGHERHTLGARSDCPQHGPGVRCVALACQPRGVVVTDDFEVETGVLRGHCVRDQLAGSALLGHQGVSESNHAPALPNPRADHTESAAASGEDPVQCFAHVDDRVEHVTGARITQLGVGESAATNREADVTRLARRNEVPHRVADDNGVVPAGTKPTTPAVGRGGDRGRCQVGDHLAETSSGASPVLSG